MEKDPCEPGMRTQFRTLADPLGLAVRHGHIGARAARLPAEVRKGSSGRFGSHAPRLSCSVWYADASSSPSLSLSGALDAPTADQACGYVRDAIESRGEVVLDLACLSLCDARGPGSARTDEQVRRAGRVLSAFGGAAAAARGDHPHYRPGRQAAGASRRLGRATSVSPAVPPVTRAHDQNGVAAAAQVHATLALAAATAFAQSSSFRARPSCWRAISVNAARASVSGSG